eukprot:Sspe_Gene.57864::Locus_31752_Transcript_1_1_Confidence_1.000_Length_1929::g.57864::m.57864
MVVDSVRRSDAADRLFRSTRRELKAVRERWQHHAARERGHRGDYPLLRTLHRAATHVKGDTSLIDTLLHAIDIAVLARKWGGSRRVNLRRWVTQIQTCQPPPGSYINRRGVTVVPPPQQTASDGQSTKGTPLKKQRIWTALSTAEELSKAADETGSGKEASPAPPAALAGPMSSRMSNKAPSVANTFASARTKAQKRRMLMAGLFDRNTSWNRFTAKLGLVNDDERTSRHVLTSEWQKFVGEAEVAVSQLLCLHGMLAVEEAAESTSRWVFLRDTWAEVQVLGRRAVMLGEMAGFASLQLTREAAERQSILVGELRLRTQLLESFAAGRKVISHTAFLGMLKENSLMVRAFKDGSRCPVADLVGKEKIFRAGIGFAEENSAAPLHFLHEHAVSRHALMQNGCNVVAMLRSLLGVVASLQRAEAKEYGALMHFHRMRRTCIIFFSEHLQQCRDDEARARAGIASQQQHCFAALKLQLQELAGRSRLVESCAEFFHAVCLARVHCGEQCARNTVAKLEAVERKLHTVQLTECVARSALSLQYMLTLGTNRLQLAEVKHRKKLVLLWWEEQVVLARQHEAVERKVIERDCELRLCAMIQLGGVHLAATLTRSRMDTLRKQQDSVADLQ